MEIKSIRQQGELVKIIGEIENIYKYNGVEIIQEAIPAYNGVSYDISYNEDTYIFVEQLIGNLQTFDVIRIGNPPKLMILKDNISRLISQYNINGDLIGDINTIEIGYGYWKLEPIEPELYSKGYFSYNNVSKPYDFNYLTVTVINTGSGHTSNGLFLDTGFSNYGYIGEKHSYFDLESGIWITDLNKTAKAEDLAKAVCFKYNLEWYDRTNPSHIYNYIKYFRTYDEENKRFLLYAPSITPGTDANNFNLIQEDEFGNTFILAISMLTVQDLETAGDGSVGVYIPFKNIN